MAYEQIIAATIDGRWMPTPGDPRDLGRLVLEVPEDGVGIGTVDVDLGHNVERDAVPLPDARFDVARGLGLLIPELVARECEDVLPWLLTCFPNWLHGNASILSPLSAYSL